MPRPKLNESEYVQSIEIERKGYKFYALIATAMRQADNHNLALLQATFPSIWESLLKWKDTPIWPLGGNR